jgi:cation-transporting ATPase 13A1
MYIFSGVFMKVSIAITLWQLTVFRAHRIILLATVIIATIPSIVVWLLMTFQCKPVSKFWRRDTPGSCLDPNPTIIFFYVYGALGALNDLCLSIIPIHLVWNLRLERRTRVAVAVILSLGGM